MWSSERVETARPLSMARCLAETQRDVSNMGVHSMQFSGEESDGEMATFEGIFGSRGRDCVPMLQVVSSAGLMHMAASTATTATTAKAAIAAHATPTVHLHPTQASAGTVPRGRAADDGLDGGGAEKHRVGLGEACQTPIVLWRQWLCRCDSSTARSSHRTLTPLLRQETADGHPASRSQLPHSLSLQCAYLLACCAAWPPASPRRRLTARPDSDIATPTEIVSRPRPLLHLASTLTLTRNGRDSLRSARKARWPPECAR
jgi:hypothetical protein